MMFFRQKKPKEAGPTTEEFLVQLEATRKNRDFFLTTIKTMIFFLKEFSLDIAELDADGFKARVEQLYLDLASDNPLSHRARVFDNTKPVILDYITQEHNYFKEKDTEFKKIIELLLDGIRHMVGENQDFNSMVYQSNLRVEKISELDDIRKIKNSLSSEVAHIKKMIQQKQSKDDRHIESLSREVCDLRSNLELAQKASMMDALTGAHNRLALDTQLSRSAERYGITGEGFSVLMCDLDDFKRINDTYGHQTGDRVLKGFVMECQRFFRSDDFIGRYGGEEFAIILFKTSLRDAAKRAQMLCKIIADKRYRIAEDNPDATISFTVSIGVATFRSKDTVDSLLTRADQALYEAKRAGKNRVKKE